MQQSLGKHIKDSGYGATLSVGVSPVQPTSADLYLGMQQTTSDEMIQQFDLSLSPASSSFSGWIVYGRATGSLLNGQVIYRTNDNFWGVADAYTDTATKMLGMSCGDYDNEDTIKVLLHGFAISNNNTWIEDYASNTPYPGNPLYLASSATYTAGNMVTFNPTGSGDYVRNVGFVYYSLYATGTTFTPTKNSIIYFRPSTCVRQWPTGSS